MQTDKESNAYTLKYARAHTLSHTHAPCARGQHEELLRRIKQLEEGRASLLQELQALDG